MSVCMCVFQFCIFNCIHALVLLCLCKCMRMYIWGVHIHFHTEIHYFLLFIYLFFLCISFLVIPFLKFFYLKVSHNNCEIEWCSENSSCFTKVAASPSLLIPNPNCFFGQFLLRRVCLIVEYATLTFDPILDTFALYVNYSSCNVICVLILVH